MIRLVIALIIVLGGVGAVSYLVVEWYAAPHRRLLRQFRKVRSLILEGVDDEQRPRAERLLEDCEEHLEGLVRARQRLDVLDEMADAASEYTDVDPPIDYEHLEARLQEDVHYFLAEMARISSEVDYDWRQSLQRLEDFNDELAEQREAFAELEELTE